MKFADMRLFVESVLAEEPWKYDAKVVPMPWRQSEADVIKSRISNGGLTIGYYDFDGKVCLKVIFNPSTLFWQFNCYMERG